MTQVFGVVSMAAGLGGGTLGLLQSRSAAGSRFESVGAFDIDPLACADFEMLTGAPAQVVDLHEITALQLRERCVRRPDVVIMSSPCKGLSSCISEKLAKTEKYQKLNQLALRCVDLVIEAWPVPPAIILFENVPRILVRGRDLLKRIKALLWDKGYELDQRVHDCGTIGGLAQKRERFLLVARHRDIAPTPLLRPPALGHRSIAEVLWSLPVPTPGSTGGGPMHRLPELAPLNWLRLAAIRAGRDWKDLPASIGMVEDGGRQSGLYGVCRADGPSHTVVARARAGSSSWASVADARLPTRKMRQNGGFGVNAAADPSHAIVAEGSVRNTWSSAADPRLTHPTRERGPWGVADPASPSPTVIGNGQCSNSVRATADPRLGCKQRSGALGVAMAGGPSPTVTGAGDVSHPGRATADPRLARRSSRTRHDGIYGVQDPAHPAHSVIAQARTGKGWADVSDPRDAFEPTHRLTCSAPLDLERVAWASACFELVGPPIEFLRAGRPCHLVIVAPDGTIHRPLTTLELAVLQGLSPWHRPGDPEEIEIGAAGGRWLDLAGTRDGDKRERIGNAIPRPTARAIGNMVLEVLDAGDQQVFRLSSGGVWVSPTLAERSAS